MRVRVAAVLFAAAAATAACSGVRPTTPEVRPDEAPTDTKTQQAFVMAAVGEESAKVNPQPLRRVVRAWRLTEA